jgi:Mrp family chromosome partitioning ATPase
LGHEKDLVTLTLTGRNRRELVSLAELYANEAIQMGREQQLAEVSRMNQFFRDRIAATGAEMARINDEMVAFQKETGTIDPESEAQAYTKQLGELLTKADNLRIELEVTVLQVNALQAEMVRQTPLAQKLEAAKARLSDLLSRYTEAHPTVKAQREQIAALERQLAGASANSFSTTGFAGNTLGGTLYLRLIELQTRKATLGKELQALDSLKQSLQDKVTGISKTGLGYAVIKARLDSQKNSLSLLANRQREAQLYEDNAQGYFRLLTQPKANDVVAKERWVKSFSFALTGFVLGVLGAMFVVAAREVTDGRLKTAADVERVTGLRVLASLNDLNAMTSSQREQWAFRTWTALSGQLSASANRGMVCGFMSSTSGEGCSTWIKLLADAAAQRGLRVLTVDAQATSAETETQTTKAEESPVHSALLTPQVLASPANVARQFAGANVPAVARVPLAGWVWNLERRKQWQSAMAQWQAVDDLVLLVELPPASAPEAVLLAESLPRVLWLVGSGRPRTRETRQQLETLRHAKCRLAGAVLNHEPEPVFSL